jgi:hypothetical protein
VKRCDEDEIQRLLSDYAAEGYTTLNCRPCVDGGVRIIGDKPLGTGVKGGVRLSVRVNAAGEVTSQTEDDY